ncbi:MAG: S46 family peptidase [Candidatus Kryptoniota bacterium]
MKQSPTVRNRRRISLFSNIRLSALIFAFIVTAAGCSSYQTTKPSSHLYFNPDTVRAGQFDTGKMWTFDYPPVNYFEQTYGFTPDQKWLNDARLSALRLSGCSASFISADGLVMTNHHCARYALDKVNRPGEDLPDSGFYAPTLNEERKVDGMYADQLIQMKDVTAEVQEAFEKGKTDEQKVAERNREIQKLQKDAWEEYKKSEPNDSIYTQVVTFYNGGKYSLYVYRRYTDIRLVFAPQLIVAYFGGDYDNFTYPRYDLDVSLFRIYQDGKPLNTEHYFRWSNSGAQENEPVFVIGNPGRTSRLLTVSQLEFNRDYSYPYIVNLLKDAMDIYSKYIDQHPDKKLEFQTRLFGISNSFKAYTGYLGGLRDQYLMARKKAFEKKFRDEVDSNPTLKEKYGSVWEEISRIQKEKAEIYQKYQAYNLIGLGRSGYFNIAYRLVEYAKTMKMPDSSRPRDYQGTALDSIKRKFFPSNFNQDIEKMFLEYQLGYMSSVFGESNDAFNRLLGGRTPVAAADYLVSATSLGDSSRVAAMLNGSPDAILSSTDPFIQYVESTHKAASEMQAKYQKLSAEEAAQGQKLGRALYDVYGTSIPPDATFTLRIADGVVKGYEYNGTIAPPFTTFYGMYNRYYSFGKKYPWYLPGSWPTPPSNFKLSTPLDFVATNDIIGGNSGSPVVNKKLEIVGLIFDGNIESLPGEYIYVDTYNRSVAVHSEAILEALSKIYHADRIVNEIKNGKIES